MLSSPSVDASGSFWRLLWRHLAVALDLCRFVFVLFFSFRSAPYLYFVQFHFSCWIVLARHRLPRQSSAWCQRVCCVGCCCPSSVLMNAFSCDRRRFLGFCALSRFVWIWHGLCRSGLSCGVWFGVGLCCSFEVCTPLALAIFCFASLFCLLVCLFVFLCAWLPCLDLAWVLRVACFHSCVRRLLWRVLLVVLSSFLCRSAVGIGSVCCGIYVRLCSTSHPGGNQVDGLPPAPSWKFDNLSSLLKKIFVAVSSFTHVP